MLNRRFLRIILFSFISILIFSILFFIGDVQSASNAKSGTSKPASIRTQGTSAYVPGEIIVKFKTGVSAFSKTSINNQLSGIEIKSFKSLNAQHIKLRDGVTVEDAVAEYSGFPNVAYAEPNYYRYLAATTPNDSHFSKLWGLNNTGQSVNGTSGTFDADIDATEVWDINTGSSSIIVAVIDSGVNYNHPDLDGNIWTNSGETASNGIDDDGNVYTDDIRGWDFVDGDNDPMDSNGHGTHVAGTIGAEGNNGLGVTGVAWNVKIMPLRVATTLGSINVIDEIFAINYAVANGAKVINLSLGSTTYSQAEKDAITAAENSGVLVVAAAMNNGTNNEVTHWYPSDYTNTNIISVAATDQNDNLASFSNYGATTVDVGAPGVDIYSTKHPRQTILSEGFESGASGWTVGMLSGDTWAISSLIAYTGSKSLSDGSGAYDYLAYTDSWATSPSFSLSGKSGCKLSTWFNYSTEEYFDFLNVMASAGGSYITLSGGQLSGATSAWEQKEFDLNAYEGSATVSIRFNLTSDFMTNYAGVYIDDFEVTCSNTNPSGTEYEYMQGTSMAAPHVSGLAALLLSQDPSLTVTELKSLIMDNGDSVSSLSGKTVSGKRINANGSLSALTPSDTTAPTTTASPGGGTYSSAQSVTLFCSDAGSGCATTYYTTNGATPTTSSTQYSSAITINSTTTLKFFSRDNSSNSESVKTEIYTINIPSDTIAPTTTASPSGGTYTSAQTVTLTCSDTGGSGCAATYYTFDPDIGYTTYTGPINFNTNRSLFFYSADNSGNTESRKVEQYTINTGGGGVTNNNPISPVLISPVNGATVSGGSIIFKWDESTDSDGDTVTYSFYLCSNQNFTGCTADIVSSKTTQVAGLGIFFFATLIAGLPRRKLLPAIVLVLLMASCGGGGGDSGGGGNPGSTGTSINHIVSTAGMSAGTYYWKVVADDGNGGTASSSIGTMTYQ